MPKDNVTPEQEIAVLRDLLETAYREIDKAREESDKADAEALEHKVRNLGKAADQLAGSYALIKHFEKRALAAEAKLAKGASHAQS